MEAQSSTTVSVAAAGDGPGLSAGIIWAKFSPVLGLSPAPIPLPCSPQVPLQGEIPVHHKALKGSNEQVLSSQSPSWITISIFLWENWKGTNSNDPEHPNLCFWGYPGARE